MSRIHIRALSSQTLRLHGSGQIKASCRVKQFVITVLFTQAGTSSKESPFLIRLFCFVHSFSKPFLALVAQTEPPGSRCRPKTLISICVSSVSTLPWLYYYSNLNFLAAYHNQVPKQAWDPGYTSTQTGCSVSWPVPQLMLESTGCLQ